MPTIPARPITKPPLTTSLFALLFAVVEADAEARPPLVVLLATLTAPLEPVAVVPAFVAENGDETAREMAELVVVVYTEASLQ